MNLEVGVVRMRWRTLLGDLRQKQRVLAHALNWLEQITAEVHAVIQLQLLRLSIKVTVTALCQAMLYN